VEDRALKQGAVGFRLSAIGWIRLADGCSRETFSRLPEPSAAAGTAAKKFRGYNNAKS